MSLHLQVAIIQGVVAKEEAVATADASLVAVGLTTYTDAHEALHFLYIQALLSDLPKNNVALRFAAKTLGIELKEPQA